MPTYEYKCKKCGKKFELVMSMSEHESKRAACPKCKSRTLEHGPMSDAAQRGAAR